MSVSMSERRLGPAQKHQVYQSSQQGYLIDLYLLYHLPTLTSLTIARGPNWIHVKKS